MSSKISRQSNDFREQTEKKSGGSLSDFGVAGLWLHQQQINYMVQCRSKVWKALISITCSSPLHNGMWSRFTKKRRLSGLPVKQATWVWSYILLDKSQMVAGISDTREETWCCSSPKEKTSQYLELLCPIQYYSASTHKH